MRIAIALLASVAACSAAATQPAAAASPAFAIIVAADVPAHVLSRESAAFIFKRKQLYWGGSGTRIQPVNLPIGHPLRRSFSLCVLGQEPEATENYWREMYFHGVVPPFVVESEQAVALFVSSTPGAIGYVSSCQPGTNVKVVFAVGNAPNCPKPTATCASLQN